MTPSYYKLNIFQRNVQFLRYKNVILGRIRLIKWLLLERDICTSSCSCSTNYTAESIVDNDLSKTKAFRPTLF
jgi:hypothetical protein